MYLSCRSWDTISSSGVQPHPSKVEAVQEIPTAKYNAPAARISRVIEFLLAWTFNHFLGNSLGWEYCSGRERVTMYRQEQVASAPENHFLPAVSLSTPLMVKRGKGEQPQGGLKQTKNQLRFTLSSRLSLLRVQFRPNSTFALFYRCKHTCTNLQYCSMLIPQMRQQDCFTSL